MAELREEVISISAFVLAAGPSLTVRKRGWGGEKRREGRMGVEDEVLNEVT